jgi:hypothetical protein
MTALDYQPLSPEQSYRCALDMLDRLADADTRHLEEVAGPDEGPCDDCSRGFARARVRLGKLVLCRECARRRVRAGIQLS